MPQEETHAERAAAIGGLLGRVIAGDAGEKAVGKTAEVVGHGVDFLHQTGKSLTMGGWRLNRKKK